MDVNEPEVGMDQKDQATALTVEEFCEKYRISKSGAYKLIREGNGPKIVKLGRRTLIPTRSASDWFEGLAK